MLHCPGFVTTTSRSLSYIPKPIVVHEARARQPHNHFSLKRTQKICAVTDPKLPRVVLDRRTLGVCGLVSLISNIQAGALPAHASTLYEDAQDAFTISIPENWKYAVPVKSEDRFRAGVSSNRTMTWYPVSGTDVNITVVITTPGADYTTLGSFGTASDFGNNLVTSMDRSFMLKDRKPEQVQVARLVKTSSDKDSYGVEYTIKKGLDEQKHLYSRVMLGSNGNYRRFYTVTATCPESKVPELESILQASVSSLKLSRAYCVPLPSHSFTAYIDEVL